MQVLRPEVTPVDVLIDRWLIEALSQMSSNPRVRSAATAWLAAHRDALQRGLAEDEAQASADEALRREIGADPAPFGHERQKHGPQYGPSGRGVNAEPQPSQHPQPS